MAQTVDLDLLDDGELQSPVPQPGADADDITPEDLAAPRPVAAVVAPVGAKASLFTVMARGGLNLRAGPATTFPVIGSLAFGARVSVLKREDAWALVDRAGDGAADGHVLASFLKPVEGEPSGAFGTATSVSAPRPIDAVVLQTIMNRCAGLRIASKLDLSEVAYALNKAMSLANATTRLRQIAFLSQAVIETDYFRTFSEYGKGKGRSYAPFYGRGIHQLTWRGTYASCSQAVFHDDRLVRDPDMITSDIEVNIKATAWYWRDYKPFNKLADAGDIDSVIHLLYGGTIDSPYPNVRRSVELRRGYYRTIQDILS